MYSKYMFNTSIIIDIRLQFRYPLFQWFPVSMIPLGGICNVCIIIIRNYIVASKMNFIQEYVSETETSNSNKITISKRTTEKLLRILRNMFYISI